MWESISSISLIVAFLFGAIFLLILVEKTLFTKSGLVFQGGILFFFGIAISLHYFASNHKVEISTYQYAQIYNIYTDRHKDHIIKKEIYSALEDGIYTKAEFERLKVNHLESLNYQDAMDQFNDLLPNVSLNFKDSTQKLVISTSVAVVNMMRFVLISGFLLFGIIYLLTFSQYRTAKKLKRDDKLSREVIERWEFITARKSLIMVGCILSFSAVGLVLNELTQNDITSSTKQLLAQYGEANKDIPIIYDAVQLVLADGRITVDEYAEIENLENIVLIEFIKKSIITNDSTDKSIYRSAS